MKNIILREYGKFDFDDGEFSDSSEDVGDNFVRIKVAYAGVSYTDYIIYRGYYDYQKENYKLPLVIGFEGSGEILSVGRLVKKFKVGDKVCFIKKFGAFQENILIEEDYVFGASDMSLKAAATFPVNFFTANYCLNYIYKVLPNESVLITNASGGVGGMLVQLAKSIGLKIFTTVKNPENKKYTVSLGAEKVFCTKDEDDMKEIKNFSFDYIFTADTSFQSFSKKDFTKTVFYGFHNFLGRNWKEKIFAIYYYLTLKKYNPYYLVYENSAVAGVNIIFFDKGNNKYKSMAEDFENFIHRKVFICPKINVYNYKDIEKALIDLRSGKNPGKYLLKF